MYRRDFLKLSGLTSMFLAISLGPTARLANFQAQMKTGEKTYRGSLDGKIFVSANQGQTWALHTNLGDQYSVLGLFTQPSGQVYAEIWFRDHIFHLALAPNHKTWLTVVRPAGLVIRT
jgi:hypothetical protein